MLRGGMVSQKQFYITYVEPVNVQRGKEVSFYLREWDEEEGKGRSIKIVKEIPHYFFSENMRGEEAEEFYRNLEVPEHLKAELVDYNSKKKFIRVEGSKEDYECLKGPFLCRGRGRKDFLNMNSPSRLLRWAYPTFMKIEDIENIPLWSGIRKRSYVDLEKAVKDNYAVLDIEVEDWEKGEDHIFMAVYVSPKQKVLWHDFSADGPFNLAIDTEFRIEKCTTQQDFGKKITQLLHEEDPLWIYGHNVMGYDQLQLRELTEEYYPSTDKHYPLTTSAQGLKRVISKGRFTLDTFSYMFRHFNLFMDNSLETLTGFTKSINYEEQSALVREARGGNRGAMEILLNYCAEDGLRAEEAGNQLKERAARIAWHYKKPIDIICTMAKSNLSADFWNRRYFLIKKTIDGWSKTLAEKEDDPYFSFSSKLQRGYFDDVSVLYLTPELAGSKDIMQKKGDILWERLRNSTDPLERYELMGIMQADIHWLLQRSGQILRRERIMFRIGDFIPELTQREEAALYCLLKYRGINIDPGDWLRSVHEAFIDTERALQKYDAILEGGGLALIKGIINQEKLERGLYGCYLGRGKALCLNTDIFIANPFQVNDPARFIYQGIKMNNKFRTRWERGTLNNLVERVFRGDDFSKIRDNFREELACYQQGKHREEDYIIVAKRRTYGKQQMGRVLEKVGGTLNERFEKIKPRISSTFTRDTEKELTRLVEDCQKEYAYPYLLELLEEIKNPYPPFVQLAYAMDSGGRLVPRMMAYRLDYETYGEKAQSYFGSFMAVLEGGEQLKLI